jgi:hypothetical protein
LRYQKESAFRKKLLKPSANWKPYSLKYKSLVTSNQQHRRSEKLKISEKQTNTFLFIIQGVGAIFVGIFLAAYLAGLPSTVVFHSEPAFRIPLTIFGVVLLTMVVSALVLAVFQRKK